MSKDTNYYLHQTPSQLAKDLITLVDYSPDDVLLEPFKGEGAFFDHFPEANPKLWAEIQEGRDYRDISGSYDWVITNPPFQLETGSKRTNSFWFLIDYFTQRANKGIAFLGNDRCFSTLTPRRLELLKTRGWFLHKVVVCSVKKWRGRYFFLIFKKAPSTAFSHLLTNYESAS